RGNVDLDCHVSSPEERFTTKTPRAQREDKGETCFLLGFPLCSLCLCVFVVSNYTSTASGRVPSTNGSNSSSDGLITTGLASSPVTASCVFRPLPVMQITISSSRGIRPCSSNLRVTAKVTPPAVSAQIPSVLPRSTIASAISSSLTSS